MRGVKKIYLIIAFMMFYLKKVIQANVFIAYDILTPNLSTNPVLIWIPIKVETDFGILLLSNLVTMTPGTLSVEVAKDKKRMLVHSLYHKTDEKLISEISDMQLKIINLTK